MLIQNQFGVIQNLRAYCSSIYTVDRIRMRLWCHIGAIFISIFGIFRGIIYLNCGFFTAANWWIFGSIFFIICNFVLFIGLVTNRTDCIKIWLIFQGIIESVSSNNNFSTKIEFIRSNTKPVFTNFKVLQSVFLVLKNKGL